MATMLPTAPLGVLLASVMAVASVSLLTSAFVTPKHSGSRLELQLPEPSQRWAARGVEVPPWGDGTEPAPAPFVSTTLGLAAFGISATWMLGRLAVAGSKGRLSVSGAQITRCARGKASPKRGKASPKRASQTADAPPPPPPFNPTTQIGAMDPLGFFDPAGFSKVGDKDGFRNLRSAELKHGRVAMMAALGAVAQHFIKFPGFESVPTGLRAVVTPPGMYGFAALFALAGVLELTLWTQDPAKEAGDFGDPLGLGMYDNEMRAREINNGRFAMFAALGIISAELLTGKDAVQQLGM